MTPIESIEDYPPMQTGTVAIGPDGTTTYVYQPPDIIPPITPPPTDIEGYPTFVTMGVAIDPDGVVWQYAPTQPGGIVEVSPPVPPPSNVNPPVLQIVSGNPTPGQTAVCSVGTWSPPQTGGYLRQWYLTGVAIPGQTGTTYIIQEADVGGVLQCGIIAIGDGGPSEQAMSNSLTIVPLPEETDPEARLDDNGGAQSPPAPKAKAKAPTKRKR